MSTKKSTPSKKPQTKAADTKTKATYTAVYTEKYEEMKRQYENILHANRLLVGKINELERPPLDFKLPNNIMADPPRETMMSSYLGELENHLCRLGSSINILHATTERLSCKSEGRGVPEQDPKTVDIASRLSNIVNYFSYHNQCFEQLNNKLSELI